MTKKVLPAFAVDDKVKWIGKEYLTGVVTEIQDERVMVTFDKIGAGWVKKISLEKIDDNESIGHG